MVFVDNEHTRRGKRILACTIVFAFRRAQIMPFGIRLDHHIDAVRLRTERKLSMSIGHYCFQLNPIILIRIEIRSRSIHGTIVNHHISRIAVERKLRTGNRLPCRMIFLFAARCVARVIGALCFDHLIQGKRSIIGSVNRVDDVAPRFRSSAIRLQARWNAFFNFTHLVTTARQGALTRCCCSICTNRNCFHHFARGLIHNFELNAFRGNPCLCTLNFLIDAYAEQLDIFSRFEFNSIAEDSIIRMHISFYPFR